MWLISLLSMVLGLVVGGQLVTNYDPIAMTYIVATATYMSIVVVDWAISKVKKVATMDSLPKPIKMVWFIGAVWGVIGENILTKEFFTNSSSWVVMYAKIAGLFLGSQILSFSLVLAWVKLVDAIDDLYSKRQPKIR